MQKNLMFNESCLSMILEVTQIDFGRLNDTENNTLLLVWKKQKDTIN